MNKIWIDSLEAIKPYITDEKYIYSDKASGKDMEREGFQNMLKALRGQTDHFDYLCINSSFLILLHL